MAPATAISTFARQCLAAILDRFAAVAATALTQIAPSINKWQKSSKYERRRPRFGVADSICAKSQPMALASAFRSRWAIVCCRWLLGQESLPIPRSCVPSTQIRSMPSLHGLQLMLDCIAKADSCAGCSRRMMHRHHRRF